MPFEEIEHIESKNSMYRTFTWCGYEWQTCAGGGRLIHPDYPVYWYDPDCVRLTEDGTIELTMHEHEAVIKHWDGVTYTPKYGAGLVHSVEAFGYGTYECECRMPLGKNLWPAFWLSGKDTWPPEIDIFEGYTELDEKYEKKCELRMETNIHYREEGEHKSLSAKAQCSLFSRLSTHRIVSTWISYKCEWTPDYIRIYYDGKLVRTVKRRHLFKKEQNTALDSFKGAKMHVLFDMWPYHAKNYGDKVYTPAITFAIRNFKYTPLYV